MWIYCRIIIKNFIPAQKIFLKKKVEKNYQVLSRFSQQISVLNKKRSKQNW